MEVVQTHRRFLVEWLESCPDSESGSRDFQQALNQVGGS